MAIHKTLTNDELLESAKVLTGTRCTSLSQITGSLRHREYKCKGDDGNHYLMKYYHTDASDSEAILVNEYNSSRFMWENNIHQIPQPINADLNHKIVIYKLLNGAKLEPKDINEEKIIELTDFLTQLHSISKIQEAAEILPAGGAVFSLDQLFENIDANINTLMQYESSNPYGTELKDLIESRIQKGMDSVKSDADMIYQSFDLSSSDLIPYEWTTISPSDLGFHNALLNNDGHLTFLDFEFFGRNDPVKVVSDFMLNPDSNLKKENYFAFLRNIIPIYHSDEETFKERLECLFPIFAVKSALLLLVDFEPANFENRMAKLGDAKVSEILKNQLQKAETLLDDSKEHMVNFTRWLKTI